MKTGFKALKMYQDRHIKDLTGSYILALNNVNYTLTDFWQRMQNKPLLLNWVIKR